MNIFGGGIVTFASSVLFVFTVTYGGGRLIIALCNLMSRLIMILFSVMIIVQCIVALISSNRNSDLSLTSGMWVGFLMALYMLHRPFLRTLAKRNG